MKKIILSLSFIVSAIFVNAQSPTFQWAKKLTGVNMSTGYSVAIDSLGNVYTTGSFWGTLDFDSGPGVYNLTSKGSHDIFVSKYDSIGNFVWAVSMGGVLQDYGYSISTDTEGNIFVTGSFYNDTVDFDPGPGVYNLFTSATEQDFFILKLDSSGNFLWAQNYGGAAGAGGGCGNSIKIDAYDNIYLTGYFSGLIDFNPGPASYYLNVGGYDQDVFVLKLDPSGNFIWAKKMGFMGIGTNLNDAGNSIAVDAAGNVYTTGYFQGEADFDPGPALDTMTAFHTNGIFISKLNASGNFVWAKNMGGYGAYDGGNSIAVDESGNVYTTGNFYGTNDFDPGPGTYDLISYSSTNAYTSKLDSMGNFVWAISTRAYQGMSLVLDAQDNVYTTGDFGVPVDFDPGPGTYNISMPSNNNVFVSKLDSSGNLLWAEGIGGTAAPFPHVSGVWSMSIALDRSNSICTTGFFQDTVDFDPGAGVFDLIGDTALYGGFFVQKMNQSGSTSSVGIKKINNETQISVYPNPSNGSFNLFISEPIKNGNIEVYNSLGELVLNEKITNQQNAIYLKDQMNGLYFIKVMSDGKIIGTEKIVKD
ncbi:MAG: SBBP repeat-containing protein [Bacteroidia bacterium]